MKLYKYLILSFILLGLSIPSTTFAYTKSSNYIDFSAWYLQKYELNTLPYVSSAIIDANNYTPLHYYAEQKQIPTASLVKLFTASALQIYPVNWSESISFSQADNLTDFLDYIHPTDNIALLNLQEGDSITKEQAFASMLIGSANNAANALPKTVSFSQAEFASVMNYQAKEYGMTNSHFVEPTGLSLQNISTAQDMVLGSCKAFENEMIRKYSGFSYYKFETNLGQEKIISHTVKSLRSDLDYDIYYAAKTGYLHETGYHLTAGLNTPKGRQICATVLSGQNRLEVEQVIIAMREWMDEMYL